MPADYQKFLNSAYSSNLEVCDDDEMQDTEV